MIERLTDEQLREQAMRMDVINKGGNPDHVLGQKLGGSDELLALRARVAKLEAALGHIACGKEVWRGNHTEVEDIDDPAEYARAALKEAPQ